MYDNRTTIQRKFSFVCVTNKFPQFGESLSLTERELAYLVQFSKENPGVGAATAAMLSSIYGLS